VLAQSAALEKLSRRVVPSAIAPNIAYRWEIDLSPGNRTLPRTFFAGRIVCLDSKVIHSLGVRLSELPYYGEKYF